MHRYFRPIWAISFTIGFGLTGTLPGQTAGPPSNPLLRIETGMHTASVRRIATDAAERFLVTASDDKTGRVWDLVSGELLKVLRPPQGEGSDGQLYAIAISPDGATVAVGGFAFSGQDASIYLFDRASGKLTKHIDGLPDAVNHLVYSADGRYLAIALLGGHGIRVYRSSDYQEIARDTDYGAGSYSAEFDRTGRLVATCDDGALRLYDASFRLVAKRQAPGGRQPYSARFSPDGSKVGVGFDDSMAVNVLSGQDLTFLYAVDTDQVHDGGLSSVAWSSDGKFLYAAGRYSLDRTFPVLRWSDSGRGTASVWSAAHNTIMDLQALSGGRLLFGSQDPAIGMLDSSGRMVWQHTPEEVDHRGNRDKLRLSRDGSIVAFGFDVLSPQGDWIRRVARFDTSERKLQIDPGPDRSLTPPRTTGLKIADWEGNDKPTLNRRALPLQTYEISRSLAISANADAFLLGTEWNLRLFDRDGRGKWPRLTRVPEVAWGVNLSQDGRYAVAALGDGTIRWFAMGDGKELLALFVHPDGRRWVAWTPEGFFDASPGGDALIGYHLNQGWYRAGEFIRVGQVFDLFYRSDLVSGRLKAGGAEAVRAARDRIGDVAAIMAGGLPPDLALVSPAESQSHGDFEFRFKVTDAGGGIGRVVYRIDGVEIQGREAGIALPGQGIQNRRFDLGPGSHEVSATVYNGKNQLESRSIAAKVNVTATEQRPALFVVAAGVTHYRDRSFDDGVKFASADAGALVTRLQAQGQGLFSSVNPYPLYDDKATRASIEKTIAEAASHIQPSDVFVLYLAGHGTAIEGQYYFIPWEVRYTSESALRQQSLDEESLRKLLAQIPAKKTLLILDTCNSGAYSSGRGPGEKTAVDRLAKITGRAVLAASASDQMALEGYQDHSVLMSAILDALSNVADSTGQVQVTTFADFVVERVPMITKERWNYEQFPMWIFQGQTFPIARKPVR
ncbi:MAG: caspase family protein [Acidobacteriia bacterium]|nr:caspase family protein [Terriglobia bacterium]